MTCMRPLPTEARSVAFLFPFCQEAGARKLLAVAPRIAALFTQVLRPGFSKPLIAAKHGGQSIPIWRVPLGVWGYFQEHG